MTITERGDPRDRITNQLPLPASRYVTPDADPAERFALYRLCECAACEGTGKDSGGGLVDGPTGLPRCHACRGEGRTRDLVATCATPEALGVAIYTLGNEDEFEECPIGILDTAPEPGGKKWLVRPWLPSARNVSDAGRTLAHSKSGKGTT